MQPVPLTERSAPAHGRQVSLTAKIVLILVAVVTGYAAIDQYLQRRLVAPSFEELEEIAAAKDVHRVERALQREIEELSARSRDWAEWDDTVRFLETGDPAFARSNLGVRSLARANVHLLYFCGPEEEVLVDGRAKSRWPVVWHHAADPEDPTRLLERPPFTTGAFGGGHPLMKLAGSADEVKGVLHTGERLPLLVSSRPVVDSRGEGPPRGRVIVGRYLSGATADAIAQRTEVEFDTWWLQDPALPLEELRLLDRITVAPPDAPVTDVRSDRELFAYTTLDDILYQNPLLIRARVPRDIHAQGVSAMRYALVSTAAAGLLLVLVLLLLLQRTVLAPLARLTRHALQVGRTDDTTVRLHSDRGDEIGVLSREMDDMLDKLAESRRALVDTARTAGMSEIATGVLHNVGNVLNSVNVSAALVARKVSDSSASDLARLVQVLDQHEDDLADFIASDPKGRHLHPFLRSLSDKMASNQQDLEDEVRSLGAGIDHVKVLIKKQQTFARRSEVLEVTDLVELLDGALEMSFQVAAPHDRLQVEREYADLASARIDRHKLMEILVNLITNARQAMEESGRSEQVLRLTLAEDSEGLLRIEVSDNGTGIDPEHIESIFHHGFTTKAEGHGFGLHSAANAATEMGGSLRAASDGPGSGATFVLEIPRKDLAPARRVA
jgi:signal transduction histidine kinase